MLTVWRIGLALLFVLGVSSTYSLAEQPVHPNTKTSKADNYSKAEQYGPKDNPLSIQVVPTPEDQAKAAKEDTYRQQKSSEDAMIMGATIWLAIVTTVLAVVTGLLWYATGKLVSGSEDTAKKQLRAYINVKDVKITGPVQGWTDPHIEIRLKNFGNVPATEVRYWVDVGVHELPWSCPLSEQHGMERIGVIAPTASFTVKRKTGSNEAPDHSTLYVFGEVHYFDGFTPNRVTKFRYMMRGGETWCWHDYLETCQDGNDAT